MPRFLERDEAIHCKPRLPYDWNGIAESGCPALRGDG